ncbi:hypothetical protein HDU67_003884, partial [Dinochytrium kinnereticum]
AVKRRQAVEAHARKLRVRVLELEREVEEERERAGEERGRFGRLLEVLRELATRGYFGEHL